MGLGDPKPSKVTPTYFYSKSKIDKSVSSTESLLAAFPVRSPGCQLIIISIVFDQSEVDSTLEFSKLFLAPISWKLSSVAVWIQLEQQVSHLKSRIGNLSASVYSKCSKNDPWWVPDRRATEIRYDQVS